MLTERLKTVLSISLAWRWRLGRDWYLSARWWGQDCRALTAGRSAAQRSDRRPKLAGIRRRLARVRTSASVACTGNGGRM